MLILKALHFFPVTFGVNSLRTTAPIEVTEAFIFNIQYMHAGLVAIRYGSQAIDPVTATLAPVVGARLDVLTDTVVPITASYWLAVADQTDSMQVGRGEWIGKESASCGSNQVFLLIVFDVEARWRLWREKCVRGAFTGSSRGGGKRTSSLMRT